MQEDIQIVKKGYIINKLKETPYPPKKLHTRGNITNIGEKVAAPKGPPPTNTSQ